MTEQKELPQLTNAQMRDYIIRAHGLATGNYVQDDTEMRRRVGTLLEKAIQEDAVMAGFLGRGGPCADRDILAGNTSLDDARPAEGERVKEIREFIDSYRPFRCVPDNAELFERQQEKMVGYIRTLLSLLPVQPAQPDSVKPDIADWLKPQCQRLRYGRCTTLYCLRRGGYIGKGGPTDYSIATCEPYEIYNALCSSAVQPAARCENCDHVNPHDGPAGDINDACTHPCCNCAYDSRPAASTPAEFEKDFAEWQQEMEKSIERTRQSEIMTADDMNIRINARSEDAAASTEAQDEKGDKC